MTMLNADLIDKHVIVFAANYIYEGTLRRDAPDAIVLDEPSIIYVTGAWTDGEWKRSERLPMPWIRLERSAVESMGPLDRSVLKGEGRRRGR